MRTILSLLVLGFLACASVAEELHPVPPGTYFDFSGEPTPQQRAQFAALVEANATYAARQAERQHQIDLMNEQLINLYLNPPYEARQQETGPANASVSQKYNAYSGRWETIRAAETLQLNTMTGQHEFARPGERPVFNPFSGQYEFPR
jgi:hypothetical protein